MKVPRLCWLCQRLLLSHFLTFCSSVPLLITLTFLSPIKRNKGSKAVLVVPTSVALSLSFTFSPFLLLSHFQLLLPFYLLSKVIKVPRLCWLCQRLSLSHFPSLSDLFFFCPTSNYSYLSISYQKNKGSKTVLVVPTSVVLSLSFTF